MNGPFWLSVHAINVYFKAFNIHRYIEIDNRQSAVATYSPTVDCAPIRPCSEEEKRAKIPNSNNFNKEQFPKE